MRLAGFSQPLLLVGNAPHVAISETFHNARTAMIACGAPHVAATRNISQKIRTGTYVRPQETYARKKSHYENVTHDLQPQQCILTD